MGRIVKRPRETNEDARREDGSDAPEEALETSEFGLFRWRERRHVDAVCNNVLRGTSKCAKGE